MASQHGLCELCGDVNDTTTSSLVLVECNHQAKGCADRMYHQDCIIDLVDRRSTSRRCGAGWRKARWRSPLPLARASTRPNFSRPCARLRTFYLKKQSHFDLSGEALWHLAPPLTPLSLVSHLSPLAPRQPSLTHTPPLAGFPCPNSRFDEPGDPRRCAGKIARSTQLHQVKKLKKTPAVAVPVVRDVTCGSRKAPVRAAAALLRSAARIGLTNRLVPPRSAPAACPPATWPWALVPCVRCPSASPPLRLRRRLHLPHRPSTEFRSAGSRLTRKRPLRACTAPRVPWA